MNLTSEQLSAIVEFARNNGRKWKSALRHAWETGNYSPADASNHLQTIRNTFGPSWLVRFNLKTASEELAARESVKDQIAHESGALTQAVLSDLRGSSKMLSQALNRLHPSLTLSAELRIIDSDLDAIILSLEEGDYSL